jgi:hypothetical protein
VSPFATARPAGCQPRDKGTVLDCIQESLSGVRPYVVAIDKDGPSASTVVFLADEIEPDV